MPVKIPGSLPARGILEAENVFLIEEHRAVHQDIRPLRIAILNLMPTKTVLRAVPLSGRTLDLFQAPQGRPAAGLHFLHRTHLPGSQLSLGVAHEVVQAHHAVAGGEPRQAMEGLGRARGLRQFLQAGLRRSPAGPQALGPGLLPQVTADPRHMGLVHLV